MKAKIRTVIDHGVMSGKDAERIVIDILEDTNMSEYMILDSTYEEGGTISNKIRHPYWFKNRNVKKGDVIVLYTKEGTFNKVENKDKPTTYFYYWGLKSFVWNNDGDAAVLLHIDDTNHHKVVKSNSKSL